MNEKVEALLKKAQKFLRSAAVLIELEDYDSTASRAYFAMFFAAQAALLQETQALSSKQGIRSAFISRFVDGGPLPERAGEMLQRASDMQEMGDYAYDFAVGAADAEHILAEAEAFVNSLENLIKKPAV